MLKMFESKIDLYGYYSLPRIENVNVCCLEWIL